VAPQDWEIVVEFVPILGDVTAGTEIDVMLITVSTPARLLQILIAYPGKGTPV
jgi:hypothetical protein